MMIKLLLTLSVLVLLFLTWGSLMPLFIGIAIAYVLDPLVAYFEKKLPANRLLCVLLAYVTVLAAAAALILGFANIIAGKIATGSIEQAILTLKLYYNEYEYVFQDFLGFTPARSLDIPQIVQSLGDGAMKFFIGMIAGIYLLKDKSFFLQLISRAMHLILHQRAHGIIRELAFEINSVIAAFIRGMFVDSVVVAFLSSLALALLQVDFAIFIGCFAGIANVIPYFGPVIGMVPAGIASLTGGGITEAILAVVALFIVQQVECNFIYPRIIGKSTGLHPLFVLIAVSVAGYYGGLLWMVLAVPLAGVMKVLINKWAESQ